MAAFNEFEDFVHSLGLGEHNLHTDTLKVYLSNATPSASADVDKTDLAEITNENGYTAPEDITNTYTEANGTGTLAAVDVAITASGGTVGPFQYAVIYNDTHASDALVGWYDYGSEVTLQDGESFTVDFGASLLTIAFS
jgi:hypothetical protein